MPVTSKRPSPIRKSEIRNSKSDAIGQNSLGIASKIINGKSNINPEPPQSSGSVLQVESNYLRERDGSLGNEKWISSSHNMPKQQDTSVIYISDDCEIIPDTPETVIHAKNSIRRYSRSFLSNSVVSSGRNLAEKSKIIDVKKKVIVAKKTRSLQSRLKSSAKAVNSGPAAVLDTSKDFPVVSVPEVACRKSLLQHSVANGIEDKKSRHCSGDLCPVPKRHDDRPTPEKIDRKNDHEKIGQENNQEKIDQENDIEKIDRGKDRKKINQVKDRVKIDWENDREKISRENERPGFNAQPRRLSFDEIKMDEATAAKIVCGDNLRQCKLKSRLDLGFTDVGGLSKKRTDLPGKLNEGDFCADLDSDENLTAILLELKSNIPSSDSNCFRMRRCSMNLSSFDTNSDFSKTGGHSEDTKADEFKILDNTVAMEIDGTKSGVPEQSTSIDIDMSMDLNPDELNCTIVCEESQQQVPAQSSGTQYTIEQFSQDGRSSLIEALSSSDEVTLSTASRDSQSSVTSSGSLCREFEKLSPFKKCENDRLVFCFDEGNFQCCF